MSRVYLICFILAWMRPVSSDKLLFIVLGGFRWDYFNIHTFSSPGFSQAFDEGVKAEYLVPSFPTFTYPNLYSIMTGLYPQQHGVLGDEMWNSDTQKKFFKGDNKEQNNPDWWNDGEPLWVTATKQGKRSYMLNWPSCDVVIRGYAPTYCLPHSEVTSDLSKELGRFMAYKEEGLALLNNDTADFVGIYFEVSEYVAHMYTPNSQEAKGVSRWLDNEFDKLIHEINIDNSGDFDVNVMVASDHGVVDVTKKKVINITNVLDMADIDHVIWRGSLVSLWPKESQEDDVFNKLDNFNDHLSVYKKADLPDRWNYKDNTRVAPINLVPDLGWTIVTANEGFPKKEKGKRFRSYNGYDNNEVKMRGIFFGFGPNLKRGLALPGLENVQLYQLMCRILRLTAEPNNGTWSHVQHAFINIPYRPLITWKRTFTYGPVCAFVVLAVIVYYIKFREPKDKSKEV